MINREVEKHHITPGGTLKDVNLLNEKKEKIFLRFQRKEKTRIIRQMNEDI